MSANSKNKEEAYNGIKELVEKFKSNYKQFHSSDYNETLTRQDFINPFFEYLGWDISNKEGLSQTYRDVIHEDKLKVGRDTTLTAGIRQSPDYSFRIGGNRVFFVEAKKPSRNLKEDSDAAYQIRRYAWSGKLSVSILTDFEEFAIYDCSKKPSPNDKASMSRIEYINYEDYLNRFDFLYDTFAKENVLRGSLEKYNADTKSKKGTESVDIDFLNSLDDLRIKLASSISKLNSLSLRDLNFAVQHIIDRIIFLRVAEDRGVENYGDLREACSGSNYYKNIVEIFNKADGKYNSGIFDFSKDKITQNIEVDNKVIKEIINDLYYPKSPYEFSVISVEIIGNAYEQFLGKTITIGKNNKAKIELKPEVRKAGGVYYTPEYIVDYIVENTVGEKIKGKTPKEIANIKIVDPACGSGSFLIGAYKYLLNYHREYYSKQGKKKFLASARRWRGSKEDAITEYGELALWVKKQILINNIFGVDIDSNAVEVTKLSLLLKCMENETPASIMNNQSLFNERALPSLDENIKCGNSLIGNDFYSGGDSLNIDIETQYKINCFDWEMEFPNIFDRKKKEVKAYHITFAIHNSRVSERMITYKVNKGEVLNLSEEDELFITKSIGEVILKNDIKCLAYNISRDHVHILLVCEDKELPEFIRKIKGKSSQKFKEYLNIPKEEVFHLWAQKYDAKEIDSDKRLYNTIEYINNNRIKHELPENNGLKPIILSFLCGQNAEVCNYTDEYNDTNGRNNAKAHNGLQPIANDNAGIQKQGVVTPCYDNANNSKKLNEISKIESYYMDTYKTTEEHNGEKQTDNIENTYEEKAHIENALNMEIECKRQIYNIDIAHKKQIYNIDITHNGLQPIVVRVQDAINEAFNQYEDGGFDIVIGNPPYGAELMDIERDYLERKYSLNNTNTAALFIGLSKHLLKDKGVNGFIIPKSFIYASNWESSRELIINDLQELVDCGKVWKEVKLEQVIIMFCNNSEINNYKASERNENNIITVGKIDKKTFREFGFYLNAVSNEELNIAYKMISSKKTVNDFCINRRGVGEQKHCVEEINTKKEYYKVLGGKNISRYYFPDNVKKYISKEYIKDDKAFIEKNSILAQRIVSYTEIPKPSIAIRAIPSDIINSLNKYILVDTINQLSNRSEYSTYFILSILNSKLISWYAYRFIYSKAIMTMQFDNPTTSRIPMPSVDLTKKSDKEVHDKLVKLVDSIIAINKKWVGENNPNTKEILERQVRALDGEIDRLVYGLYGLSDNEIRIIE
ncbi:hypothetical protein EPJ73_06055, partial [Brachyspira aalborgi]